MELGEIGQAPLLVLGVVRVGAAFWIGGRAADRRRQERFGTPAPAWGSGVVRAGEHLSCLFGGRGSVLRGVPRHIGPPRLVRRNPIDCSAVGAAQRGRVPGVAPSQARGAPVC